MFKPTYLYIKTHNKTGLKYFGKTSTKDPYKYKGSGKRWKRHIKKHGYNCSTEIIGHYLNEEECKNAAIKFSKEHNIVESEEWANLKEENGIDGGNFGEVGTFSGRFHTEETKEKIKLTRSKQTFSQESLVKISENHWSKTDYESFVLHCRQNGKREKTEQHKENISKSLLLISEKKKELYELNPIKCKKCNKNLTYKQFKNNRKFCSRSCGSQAKYIKSA